MHDPIDRRNDTGPFDIIGDVHGCADELRALLAMLGYEIGAGADRPEIAHPQGRRVIFVGDLVNRGPKTPETLRLAMAATEDGGYAVEGNHDESFRRWLRREPIEITSGLRATIEQLATEPEDFPAAAQAFLAGFPSHCWLDGGRLAVAHAGLLEGMIGQDSEAVRAFAVHGDGFRKTDDEGRPLLSHWVLGYGGATTIVYGHTPVAEPEWINNTICLDTGCVAGGRLTALRWPERELVSVPAARVYAKPARPFVPPSAGRQPG